MRTAEAARLHPSRWPLAVWLLVSVGVAYLRVDYTLGSLSFAPAIALLSGTWLGSLRAASVQALATTTLIPAAILVPGTVHPGEWGFRLGLVASAALAGAVSKPDDSGARPPRPIRLTVFGVACATAVLVAVVVPRVAARDVGVVFGLTFVLATAIGVFYSYKIVAEPGRVAGYFFCLLPYYATGFAANMLLAWWRPDVAIAAGIPDDWTEILFHAYFSHLPGELISLVVIAYVVCAIDRQGAADGPYAISASR